MTAGGARAPGHGRRLPPKVLYIGGSARTGSTVLGKLLGQFPAVFSAGELTFLWEYGLARGGRCSCGARLTDCEVWSSALDAAFGSEPPDPRRMVELRRRFWSGHLPLMLLPGGGRRGLLRLQELPRLVERVYGGLASVSGARVVVDSSKEPHYSYILREATELPVYFLHLVRDPRAVGFSWSHHPLEHSTDGGVVRERRGPMRASTYYAVSNAAAEALWAGSPRYRLLRYEDFVERPRETVLAIGALLGEELPVDDVLQGRRFRIRSLHSAWENPNRFERGEIELTADERWRRDLSRRERAELTALNWPFIRRYGYRSGHGASCRVHTNRRPLLTDARVHG
jgi:hypothetical protein